MVEGGGGWEMQGSMVYSSGRRGKVATAIDTVFVMLTGRPTSSPSHVRSHLLDARRHGHGEHTPDTPCSPSPRQAAEALAAGEVPVGCVFVRDGAIIARARNRTNQLHNVRPRPHSSGVRTHIPHARPRGMQNLKPSTSSSQIQHSRPRPHPLGIPSPTRRSM